MSARDRLLKRKPRDITIDGEQYKARTPTLRESLRFEALLKDPETQKQALEFFITCCLLEEDGSPMFLGESDESLQEIPVDRMQELATEIGKLAKVPSLQKTEKNSDATP
jgi:hypothetical protein